MGSSVSVVTHYGMDGPGSNPGGDKILRLSRQALGPTQPLYHDVTWSLTSSSRGLTRHPYHTDIPYPLFYSYSVYVQQPRRHHLTPSLYQPNYPFPNIQNQNSGPFILSKLLPGPLPLALSLLLHTPIFIIGFNRLYD